MTLSELLSFDKECETQYLFCNEAGDPLPGFTDDELEELKEFYTVVSFFPMKGEEGAALCVCMRPVFQLGQTVWHVQPKRASVGMEPVSGTFSGYHGDVGIVTSGPERIELPLDQIFLRRIDCAVYIKQQEERQRAVKKEIEKAVLIELQTQWLKKYQISLEDLIHQARQVKSADPFPTMEQVQNMTNEEMEPYVPKEKKAAFKRYAWYKNAAAPEKGSIKC